MAYKQEVRWPRKRNASYIFCLTHTALSCSVYLLKRKHPRPSIYFGRIIATDGRTKCIYMSLKSGASPATNCYSLNAPNSSSVLLFCTVLGPVRPFVSARARGVDDGRCDWRTDGFTARRRTDWDQYFYGDEAASWQSMNRNCSTVAIGWLIVLDSLFSTL